MSAKNEIDENQINSTIVRKMIGKSIREGLDIGQSLLISLNKDLHEPLAEITGVDEIKTMWDTLEGKN